jgi:hypothetical protein
MTTHTFPITGPINLLGRVAHGSFTVHERDDIAEATVSIEAQDPKSDLLDRAVVDMRGHTLTVVLPRKGGVFDLPFFGGPNRDAVDITVTVPSGTPVKISSFTAPIVVDGRSGSADIASGATAVDLDHVDGNLRLRFGSGTGRARLVSGSVQARSGSGDLDLGEVGGELNCACGSGQLDVQVVRGAVRFRTGSGRATLGAVHADVDVATGSGELSIGLPSGRPARLDVSTGVGRLNSELPIDDKPTSEGTPITVRAKTGTGNIRLFRAA